MTLGLALVCMIGWVRSANRSDSIRINLDATHSISISSRKRGITFMRVSRIISVDAIDFVEGRTSIPYWSIVIPLTLLSAWLLLSRPPLRKSISRTRSEFADRGKKFSEMSDLGVVYCPQHGKTRPAFVCHHLVNGVSRGFLTPNLAGISKHDADELQAWCSDCERVRHGQGEWNDISEGYANITMICEGCFDAARERNEVGAGK